MADRLRVAAARYSQPAVDTAVQHDSMPWVPMSHEVGGGGGAATQHAESAEVRMSRRSPTSCITMSHKVCVGGGGHAACSMQHAARRWCGHVQQVQFQAGEGKEDGMRL